QGRLVAQGGRRLLVEAELQSGAEAVQFGVASEPDLAEAARSEQLDQLPVADACRAVSRFEGRKPGWQQTDELLGAGEGEGGGRALAGGGGGALERRANGAGDKTQVVQQPRLVLRRQSMLGSDGAGGGLRLLLRLRGTSGGGGGQGGPLVLFAQLGADA